MILELLKSFCDETREPISGPYTPPDSEYTFATDAFILVRVPRIPEVIQSAGPNPKIILEKTPIPADGWINLPEIPTPPICQKCNGNPKAVKPCLECDGEGEVSFDTKWHTYECTCKACGGDGETGGCSACGGTGHTEVESIQIGSRKFRPDFIRRLAKLPGIQIAPTPEPANWFRFDGGDGLVMPVTEANPLQC